MKITLQNEKTITQAIEVDLSSNFTIFAGKNNSGKTQIINEIETKLIKEGKHAIKISAEKVILENEITTGSKDEFKANLSKLINLTFAKNSFTIENKIDDISRVLPKLFKEYNVENIEVSALSGNPKKEEYEKACKDLVIKKALESITIKDTLSGNEGIALKDAGQGVERLVIVSLIRFIADKLNTNVAETYLLIEEPEIYLHPKLKKSFYEALKKLSTQNTKIIITTHDPYFISLTENETIYKVYRGKDGNTELEKIKNTQGKLLSYKSNAEVNYVIFDFPTSEYGLQLYEGFIKHKERKEGKEVQYDGGTKKLVDIRNEVAHPKRFLKDKLLEEFITGIIDNKD